MPFETMGQRGLSASSCFGEEICFSSEKELGFWKPKTMHYYQDGQVQTPHKSVVSSPLEKLFPADSEDCFELPPFHVARDHREKHHIGAGEGTPNFSRALGEYINNNKMASPNLFMQAVSYSMETNKTNINGTQYWNSLSSNTLSEMFGRKLGLTKNNVLLHKSADTVASCHEEEPFGSMKENEAQTIKNLLPDEDDLFSGVIDGLEYIADAKGGDDAEDFDLFSSVGGMELEVDDVSCAGQKDSDFTGIVPDGQGSSNGSIASTHPYGEHPSRTLFVRNINSNVEDSELRVLFEQYGDIRTLYTACKHRGFVMISYFDIRAARNAMRALQNKLLGCQKLDIHYLIPKDNPLENDINQGTVAVSNLNYSISNNDLHQIFGIYGEIKEIHETPHKFHPKFIEFYDVRAAEAARCALNKCNIAGKWINLGPSSPGGARQCLIQKCSELEQDEAGLSGSSRDISTSESMSTISHGGRTVGCYDNGSVQGLHSASHVPLSGLTENALSHGSSCVLNSLPSPLRVASAVNHPGFHKSHHSVDQVKSKCIPSFHPHSFPDCQDNFNISVPHNSSSTVANMAGKFGSRVSDGMNGRHISTVGSNGQLMELKGGISGPSGNATCPVHGHYWSNSNSFQQHPSSPVVWPNSSLFSNGVNGPCPQQLTGLSGMSPDVLNTVSSPHHLHTGSAPSSVSPSLWNRQRRYTGESPEGSAFCLGSLGSVGFLGSSPLHLLGRASHIFSHAGGNCMEKSTNDALQSPHQMSYIYPSQNTVTSLSSSSLSSSFGSPRECVRNLSYRRNQGNSSHADKKQFELDIDRILCGEDNRTTFMIKNIPNKYTSKMLLAAIDEHCRGTYDFIYLPIDFKNKCNVGYAFVNLIDPLQIIPFYKAFNGKKWEKFNSEKVAALAYARIQGKAALVAHFQNSSLMNEDKRCRPILFCTDGPNAGEQEPFPMGTNFRLKAGKAQSNVNEESHGQGSPSMSVNGSDSPNGSDSSGSARESD